MGMQTRAHDQAWVSRVWRDRACQGALLGCMAVAFGDLFTSQTIGNTARAQSGGLPDLTIDSFRPQGEWAGDWRNGQGWRLDWEMQVETTLANRATGVIDLTWTATGDPQYDALIGQTCRKWFTGVYVPANRTLTITDHRLEAPPGTCSPNRTYRFQFGDDGEQVSGNNLNDDGTPAGNFHGERVD